MKAIHPILITVVFFSTFNALAVAQDKTDDVPENQIIVADAPEKRKIKTSRRKRSAVEVLNHMGFQTKISARNRLVIHVNENGSSTTTHEDSSNGN